MTSFVSFDLDGTLLDTSEGISQSVRYTIDKMGLALPANVGMDFFIGPPIQMSLQRCFGVDEATAQQGAELFRSYYKTEALFLAKPYEGVFELLEELRFRHIKIGVATYKREDYALEILRHFHISDYCNAMCGADNNNQLTKSDIIRNSCIMAGVASRDTLYVGDTLHDAKGAFEAGTPFVAVTWGFGFNNDNYSSDYPIECFVNKPVEILDIIG